MSDYTQIVYFAPKDGLTTGNPLKKIKGTEFDAELAAISIAILSKLDSADVASNAEAAALASTSKLLTPASLLYALDNGVFDTAGGLISLLTAATPVVGDELMIWDQSTGNLASCQISDVLALVASVGDASTTVAGKVELATSAEAIAGTDAVRAVTPDALADTHFAVVWDNGGSWIKRSPGAASWSLTKNGSGDYTITHSLGLASLYDLVAVAQPHANGSVDQYMCHVAGVDVNSIRVYCFTDTGAAGDPARFNLIAVRAA
jgi:hypothetical protein